MIKQYLVGILIGLLSTGLIGSYCWNNSLNTQVKDLTLEVKFLEAEIDSIHSKLNLQNIISTNQDSKLEEMKRFNSDIYALKDEYKRELNSVKNELYWTQKDAQQTTEKLDNLLDTNPLHTHSKPLIDLNN